MAELYSQYVSGNTLWLGPIIGSSAGSQGINPIVNRINSITDTDNIVIGSAISGTGLIVYPGSIIMISGAFVVEQKSSNPGDIVQGRLWIEI